MTADQTGRGGSTRICSPDPPTQQTPQARIGGQALVATTELAAASMAMPPSGDNPSSRRRYIGDRATTVFGDASSGAGKRRCLCGLESALDGEQPHWSGGHVLMGASISSDLGGSIRPLPGTVAAGSAHGRRARSAPTGRSRRRQRGRCSGCRDLGRRSWCEDLPPGSRCSHPHPKPTMP